MTKPKIVDITEKNISDYQPRCFLKEGDKNYDVKADWLKKRFKEGLKIKQLYLENDKKANGFIEYVPGEKAWRGVLAKNYLFIHCLWMYPNKFKKKGHGSLLVKEVLKDAKEQGKLGVAVITSEGSFMSSKEIFEKNGFKSVEYKKPFDLMVKQIKRGPIPKFKDTEKELAKYKGWHIVYNKQCPWVIRFINEMKPSQKKRMKIKELKTAKEAQNGPSIYGSFNLIHDGKLLADHFISNRRFENILKKEG